MTNKEIAVLVRNVQKNKENAFEKLYKEIWNTVYYFCYKSLGDKQDANDAMQTVFLQVYNTINTLREPKAFNKFLYKIMTHTCSNFHKSKSRDDMDELEIYESIPEDNTEFLPNEAYETEDTKNEIAKMIETLPQKQRETILLFYYEGMQLKEIAEITDSEVNAVKNRLFTARKTLKERAETLIEKGALNYTMSILPIPILTRILLEETQKVATPEICEHAWQGICASLGIAAAAGVAGTAGTTTTATTAATATTTGVGTNIAIGLTCAAIIAVGGYIAVQVNNNFINPPAIVEEYQEKLDAAALIHTITNHTEFIEFTDKFGFMLLGGSRFGGRGSQTLYYLEEPNRFIYLGYTESPQGEFRIVYEITDERSPITYAEIPNWFASR